MSPVNCDMSIYEKVEQKTIGGDPVPVESQGWFVTGKVVVGIVTCVWTLNILAFIFALVMSVCFNIKVTKKDIKVSLERPMEILK